MFPQLSRPYAKLKRLRLESLADPEPSGSAAHFAWSVRESRRQAARRKREALVD